MSPELVSILNQLPLHTVLMIGIIVLWRDNKALRQELKEARKVMDDVQIMTIAQNAEISAIKSQTNGFKR